MFGLFPLLPAAASLILGIVYVALGEASVARKLTVAVGFPLALGLAVWRKTDRA